MGLVSSERTNSRQQRPLAKPDGVRMVWFFLKPLDFPSLVGKDLESVTSCAEAFTRWSISSKKKSLLFLILLTEDSFCFLTYTTLSPASRLRTY